MNKANQLIKKIRELKEEDSYTSYSHIKNILKNQRIITQCTEYQPNKLIRYRRHSENCPHYFKHSSELEFRRDILNISEFGRCNEPGQGFFYCNDNQNEHTGLAESLSLFRGNLQSTDESFTIGAWNLNAPLKLAVILPSENLKGKNNEFDKLKTAFSEFQNDSNFEELKILIEFIANEYTLDLIKEKSNYKVTCAFSNYVKESFSELDGIMYASVKSEFTGQNIVLWPEVVEKKLEFYAARRLILKKVSENNFVQSFSSESLRYEKDNDQIIW